MDDSAVFIDSALSPEGSWDRLQPLIVTLHQQVNQQRFPSVYKNIIGDMSCVASVLSVSQSEELKRPFYHSCRKSHLDQSYIPGGWQS